MSEPVITPRRATKADVPAITDALVRSFAGEPFHRWMVPDADQWAARAPRYFNTYVKMILRDGYADTVDGNHGAALWMSPHKPGGGLLSRIQVPFLLWRLAGQKFRDVWSVIPLIERHRPKDPHWYLDILGVDPSHGRQGFGLSLLIHGLKRSDAAGQSVFLDTFSQDNIRFYERHGFEVTASFTLPSGLPVWTMVRTPRGADKGSQGPV